MVSDHLAYRYTYSLGSTDAVDTARASTKRFIFFKKTKREYKRGKQMYLEKEFFESEQRIFLEIKWNIKGMDSESCRKWRETKKGTKLLTADLVHKPDKMTWRGGQRR